MITSDFYDTGHGGVEGHILGIAREFKARGHDVTVVRTTSRAVIHAYDSSIDGIDYHVLPSVMTPAANRSWAGRVKAGGRVGLTFEFIRRLTSGVGSRRKIEEFLTMVGDVDVVHQHSFLEAIGLTRALARQGTKVVWTNHLGEFLYLRKIPVIGPSLLRRLTRHFSAAAAPSGELADQAAIHPDVRMIPNGVDVDRFRPLADSDERLRLRTKLGWPQDQPVVILPRRWAPTKGVVFAAQAMCLPQWPSVAYVVFAGSGTREYPGYSQQIREYLAESSKRHEVHEGVSQDVMAEMLRAADVCLIPSVKEATSLSALEAMSSGLVVVAAAVGGLPEIIVHGTTGYLHDPRDPLSIANTVAAAIDSDGPVGTTAREFVLANHSWNAIAAETFKMYGSGL